MSDVTIKDAAIVELKQVTTGWLKQNGQPRYPNGPPVTTHWYKAMNLLSQISVTNATPRNAAVAALKKTTKGYNVTGNYWIVAMGELANIVDVTPPPPKIIYPSNTLYPAEVSP